MKKISYFLSGMIAIFYFLSVFFSLGNQNYMMAINMNHYLNTNDLSKEDGIQLRLNNYVNSDQIAKQELLDIFKAKHAIAIGNAKFEGAELQRTITYVYAEKDIFVEQFNTKNNERINLNDDTEDRYYATKMSNDKAVLIDLLNPMYYSYSSPYEIHPFHQSITDRMPILINVLGIEKAEFQAIIKSSAIKDYVVSVDSLMDNMVIGSIEEDGIQFDSNEILMVCSILSLVTLMILIVVQIVKNKKYIAVTRLHGISKGKIITQKFSRFLFGIFLSYSSVQLLLLYLICGRYRDVNKELYEHIILSIIVFVLLIVVLLLFVYIYLSIYRNFHDLKQNKINNFSIMSNVVVKVIMTTVLIAPFVTLVPDTYYQIQETNALFNMKEESTNRYQFQIFANKGTNIIGGSEANQIISTVCNYLSEHYNGKVFDMFDWYSMYQLAVDEGYEERYQIPYVKVNKNYLQDYTILNENEKSLNFKELQGEYLLVPRRYENSVALDTYQTMFTSAKIIYISDIDAIFKPLLFLEMPLMDTVKNPIIYLCDEQIPQSIGRVFSNYFINTNNINKVYHELSLMGFKDNITFISLMPAIEQEYNKQFITFSSMIFLLFGYIAVYLTFVYQSVFVYLDVYSKKLSIQYLNGYSYVRRYHEIYIINAVAYVIAGIGAYIFFDVALLPILMYILFFGGIEVLFEMYQVYQFERKRGIQSLK